MKSDLRQISDLLASDIRERNITATAPNLILAGVDDNTEYHMEADNTLVRQIGAAAAEILSQDIITFNSSCISVGGNDCPTAIGINLQLTMRATDTNNIALNFRVGVRNNILTNKFES